MEPKKLSLKSALVIAALVVIAVVFIFSNSRVQKNPESAVVNPSSPSVENPSSLPSTAEQSPTANPSAQPSQPASQPAPTATAVKIVMPAIGETWMLGKSHTIEWSARPGYSGGIVLLDAGSKNIVGWVTPNILANQVQYGWNTRSLVLSRTNSAGKEVAPGVYIFRIVFDGTHQPIDSAPFSIIAAGEERIITQNVSIKNYIFSPSVLTVKRGAEILIMNEEVSPYTLQMNGVSLVKLPQGSTYVFDTNGYSSGTYEFKLKEQAIPRLTIVVE